MERKKSKKGNKKEGGEDGESRGEGSVAYRGNGGVQSAVDQQGDVFVF